MVVCGSVCLGVVLASCPLPPLPGRGLKTLESFREALLLGT